MNVPVSKSSPIRLQTFVSWSKRSLRPLLQLSISRADRRQSMVVVTSAVDAVDASVVLSVQFWYGLCCSHSAHGPLAVPLPFLTGLIPSPRKLYSMQN